MVNKAYQDTSAAVHDGVLRGNADFDRMIEVAALAQKAILKLIEHGGANWSNIELGLVEE